METSITKKQIFVAIALCLIFAAVVLRLMPHPPNFAPIAAVAIFGAAMLPRRLGLAVPLAAIIATDFIIGLHSLIFVTWGSYALIALASSHVLRAAPDQAEQSPSLPGALGAQHIFSFRYSSNVLFIRFRAFLKKKMHWAFKRVTRGSSWIKQRSFFARTAVLTLGASVFFFVITNFAVWLTSGMYERTLAGLAQCFTLALPFFRNTLASDIIYTAALFGVYALATRTSLHFVESKLSRQT